MHQEYFEGTVYTFGFGPDHDADLLEAISTQGGGVYYFINTIEKVCYGFEPANIYNHQNVNTGCPCESALKTLYLPPNTHINQIHIYV